jgi:phosphatidylglycerol:prolipoprotein diacylglycerol transferase
MFDLSAQGFSGYGGIILAWIAWWLVCLYYKRSVFKVADLITPFLGLGIGAMRLWCFLQWCCFGTSTDAMRWVRFPEWSETSRYQLYEHIAQHGFFGNYHIDKVHPTQIYDMLVALSGAVISYRLWKKWAKEGIPFLFFIIRYTVGKYLLTPFRAPSISNDARPELFLIIYIITTLVICIAFFAYHFKNTHK